MNLIPSLIEWWRGLERRDRLACGYSLIAVLILVLLWSALAARTAELERKRLAREKVLTELLPLKAAYKAAKAGSDQLAGRLAAVRSDDSPARIIEEIGIRGKGIKVTPLKSSERGTVVEDVADVRIDGLTANEAVNLLYRLEKGSRPISVRKATLRTRFDDPSRMDCAVTIALLKPAGGPAR